MADIEDDPVNLAEQVLAEARKQTENLNRACLSDMVTTLNEQKLKLLMTIKDLKQQLIQQKTDQADIYFYLNKKCDDAFEVIAALEEQMATEQADREISEKIFEKKILDLQANADAAQVRLKSKIGELEDTLGSMKEFKDRKESQEKQLHDLIETLDMERRQYTQQREDMENRWIQDKNKMQRDYAEKQRQIQSEVTAKVGDQLSVVTKETQSKNVVLKHELKYQSVQADKVLHISQNIINKDKTLKIELDLSKANEKELINKLGTYQKVIKQLNEKIENDQHEHNMFKEEMNRTIEEQNIALEDLQTKLKIVHDKNQLEDSQLDEMWIFLSDSFHALKKNNRRLRHNAGSISSLSAGGNAKLKSDYEYLLIDLIYSLLESHPNRFANVIDDYLDSNPHHSDSKASNQRIDSLKELSQLEIGMDSLYSVSLGQNQGSQIDNGFLPDINGGRSRGKEVSLGGVSWADSSSIAPGAPKGSRSIGIQVDVPSSAPSYSRMPPSLMMGLGYGNELEDNDHSIFSAPNNPFGALDEPSTESVSKSTRSAYYGQAKYTLGSRSKQSKAKSAFTKISKPGVPHVPGRVANEAQWSAKDELKKENLRLQKYIPPPMGDKNIRNNNNNNNNNNYYSESPKRVNSVVLGVGPMNSQLSPNQSRTRKFLEVDSGFSISGQPKSILSGSDRSSTGPSARPGRGSNPKGGSSSSKGRRIRDSSSVGGHDRSIVSEISLQSGEFLDHSPRSEVTSPVSTALTLGTEM